MKPININLNEVAAIIFDFDGVFTDNTVLVASDGTEALRFSKLDSLGVDLFREHIKSNNIHLDLLVLTKETNAVVTVRTQKLGLKVMQGIKDKWTFISQELQLKTKEFIYFGNDVNDLESMKNSLISFAPTDAHPKVKEIATYVLPQHGGNGFVREGLELLMQTGILREEE